MYDKDNKFDLKNVVKKSDVQCKSRSNSPSRNRVIILKHNFAIINLKKIDFKFEWLLVINM